MKKYGILAYPAKHSLSPAMHNAAFRELKMDSEYRVYEIPEPEFGDFLKTVKHEPISGLSVSLPYKEVIFKHLNVVDEDVKKIEACNTVFNKGGILYGYNTDHVGSNMALEEVVGNLNGAQVCVMGAGGAARAIVYGLKKSGADVVIVNRSQEKAQKLAEEMGASVGDLSCSGDILIQATSVWTLNPDTSLEEFAPREFVSGFDIVMDIVYKPLSTPLLAMAADIGKQVVTGEKMLLYQGVKQFEIWTGEKAPVEVMREALILNL